jgi:hypothetical protein
MFNNQEQERENGYKIYGKKVEKFTVSNRRDYLLGLSAHS